MKITNIKAYDTILIHRVGNINTTSTELPTKPHGQRTIHLSIIEFGYLTISIISMP